MPVFRVALSHRSALPPAALRAALARRVRRDAWRPLFRRVDLLVGELDGQHVWLRPVATRWENPPCQLAGVIEPRDGGSVLHGEMGLPRRIDRIMATVSPVLFLALAIPVAIRYSPAAALPIVGMVALMRLLLHVFCLRARAEILRVVRLVEAATAAPNSTATASPPPPLPTSPPAGAGGEENV